MSKFNFKNFETLTNLVEIKVKLFNLEKMLFDLKIQKANNKKYQSHLFKVIKRQIAQLKFKFFQIKAKNSKEI